MISEKMSQALNEQLNWEIYSSYVYASMASWMKGQNLNGFANWMNIQVREELDHAAMFYEFLHDLGADVEFEAVPKPNKSWEDVEAVFKETLEHERGVTSRINNLIDLALADRDHATNARLQWFISEQVEEEASVLSIIQQLQIAKNSPNALFMIDRELAQRVYNPPSKSE
jgi:ferritin